MYAKDLQDIHGYVSKVHRSDVRLRNVLGSMIERLEDAEVNLIT